MATINFVKDADTLIQMIEEAASESEDRTVELVIEYGGGYDPRTLIVEPYEEGAVPRTI
jgi:hypothetical protein